VYCANIEANKDQNYVDLEVSGMNNGFSAYIADYGGADPQRFEVVEGRFVRIYLFGGGVYFGDCNIAIGQRFVGSTVVVTPRCSDPSLAPQIPNLGEYAVDARLGGSAISVGSSVDPDTGALSVALPQGASLSVSYAIKADYSRLWYLDEQSAVVVNIASGADTDTPVEHTFKVARRALYSVRPSPNPPSGQSAAFRVVSPASPDVVESGVPYYIGGTDVVVKALLGEEEYLSAVYLDDLDNVNFASYTKEDGGIDGDSVTIRGISRSCYVRGTFAARQYGVTCAADTASADALTVAVSASSVVKNMQVTFTATPAIGYSFEGWYLDGEPAPDSTVEEEGVPTTYHYNDPIYKCAIASDIHLVAKAKVEVSLGVSGSGNLIIDGVVVTTPYTRDVTLGESFRYSAQPVGENIYFLLWYESDLVTPVYGYRASGTIAPTAPLVMVAKFDTIDPTKEIVVFAGYVERNTGREGAVLIDGEEVSSAVRLAGDTVVFSVKPRNGWVFGGWFANPAGQGNPVSKDAEIPFLAYLHPELYALFEVNTHAICEWEGTAEPKELVWRSKTYVASKPFNPSACRVDALGYPPGLVPGMNVQKVLALTVDMFSAPDVDAKPTASTTLTNIANQDARRLPVRRMERYMQVAVKANVEIDALLVGTSMEGLAI
jgi:hypothetical protein